jgi:hypothetical protein
MDQLGKDIEKNLFLPSLESKSESERGTKGVEREGEEEVHTTIYLLNILLFYFIINHECLP